MTKISCIKAEFSLWTQRKGQAKESRRQRRKIQRRVTVPLGFQAQEAQISNLCFGISFTKSVVSLSTCEMDCHIYLSHRGFVRIIH